MLTTGSLIETILIGSVRPYSIPPLYGVGVAIALLDLQIYTILDCTPSRSHRRWSSIKNYFLFSQQDGGQLCVGKSTRVHFG